MSSRDKSDESVDVRGLTYKYRLAIAAFLMVILMAMMFKAGVLYSCADGFLQGDKCVKPRVVEMLQVCEYNQYSCHKTCAQAMITDREAFEEQYAKLG